MTKPINAGDTLVIMAWLQRDPSSNQGVMGITGDGLPYVGPVPAEQGLWISAGFNGHGKLLVPRRPKRSIPRMYCTNYFN